MNRVETREDNLEERVKSFMSRRSFLGSSLAVGAGTIGAGLLATLPTARASGTATQQGDLEISISEATSPQTPITALIRQEFPVHLQFPTSQIRQVYATTLECFRVNRRDQRDILTAYDQVLGAIDAKNLQKVVDGLFNLKDVIDATRMAELGKRHLFSVANALVCIVLCPVAPTNPRPGTRFWLLVGWLPGNPFRGTIICIYICR